MALGYLRKVNGVDVYGPFYYDTSPTGQVGLTTSQVKLGSIKINGRNPDVNYLTENDMIYIEARLTKSSVIGTAYITLRLGSNQSTTDAQIGILSPAAGYNLFPLTRVVKINGTSSYTFGATSSQIAHFGTNLLKTDLGLDFTSASSNYYVTVWAQMGLATQTMSLSYLSCKIIRSTDGSTSA